MPKTAAHPDYAQYAGYGQHGYHPGLDDPRVLEPRYYQEPKQPDKWPDWALPSALIASGLLGITALGGLRLGKGISRAVKSMKTKVPLTPPPAAAATTAKETVPDLLNAKLPPGPVQRPTPDLLNAQLTPTPAAHAPTPVGSRGSVTIDPVYAQELAQRGLGLGTLKVSSILSLLGQIARR